MFCHKCGNQIVEESAFCPKCGEKLIKDGMVQQTHVDSVTVPESKPIKPFEASSHSTEPKKKIPKKLILGLAGIAVVIIAAIVIVLNMGGGVDHIDMVKTSRPFDSGENKRYWGSISPIYSMVTPTYDDVFSKYIDPIEWTVTNKNLGHVEVNGTLKGSGEEIMIGFNVSPEGALGRDSRFDYYSISSYEVIIAGKSITDRNEITNFLYDMFDAYVKDNDYFRTAGQTSVTESDGVTLSETYTNDDEGFSFKYPTEWTVKEDSMMVTVFAPAESEYSASISIMKGDIDESYFSASTSDFETTYSLNKENFRMIKLSDVTLNGHPARKLIYSFDDDRGSYTQIQHFYIVNSDMYFVTCSSLEGFFKEYEPVFDAIMNSYAITADATSGGEGSAENANTTYVEQDSATRKGHDSTLVLYSDGSFDFNVSVVRLAQVNIHGTYNKSGDTCDFTSQSIEGPAGVEEDKNFQKFAMIISGDKLIYSGDWFGLEGLTLVRTSDGSGLAPSNHDDAYNIAQAWLNDHQDMGATISGGDNDLYQADGEEYYLFYLSEMHYANLLVNSRTGALSIMINHDGEHPFTEIEPLDDYYNRFFGTPQLTSTGELLYNDTPVYEFFRYTIDDIIDSWYGQPSSYEDYDGGRYYYDHITFICDDSTGKILCIELDPSACEVDGNTLNKPKNRLIGILGTPAEDDFIRDIQGGTNEVVGYYMKYTQTEYSFSLIMPDSEGIPFYVDVRPN